jgi:hypothetical protein
LILGGRLQEARDSFSIVLGRWDMLMEKSSSRSFLKGTIARDEYFLKVQKIETVPRVYFLNERFCFSQFLVVFLWRKSKTKFLLASIKSSTVLTINPLLGARSCFLIAACVSKSYS